MRRAASAPRLKRLPDCVRPPVEILFVGINPGIRSAQTGHHFAGYSNRFWTLLFDSGLIPEPLRHTDDRRVPEWGLGITNLIPRPTAGIDTLRPREYVVGLQALRRNVRRWRPRIVAFVGVTIARVACALPRSGPVELGLREEMFEGTRVFVLPNPSGRNAHFRYDEMLRAYRALASLCQRTVRSRDAAGERRSSGGPGPASSPLPVVRGRRRR